MTISNTRAASSAVLPLRLSAAGKLNRRHIPSTKVMLCRGDLNSTSLRSARIASQNRVRTTVSKQSDKSLNLLPVREE